MTRMLDTTDWQLDAAFHNQEREADVGLALGRYFAAARERPGDNRIRTMLTKAQALANLASQADQARAVWRAWKGFAQSFPRWSTGERGRHYRVAA